MWPSGLRRWLKAPFRKGVGSNPHRCHSAWHGQPLKQRRALQPSFFFCTQECAHSARQSPVLCRQRCHPDGLGCCAAPLDHCLWGLLGGDGSFCYLCAQVADLQSCDSSVGRASDWRSEGPRLDPGSRQLLIVHMVGNSWGLRKLGRDDLGDFSFKENNACSSVEKTAKSSRLAFLNVDLGLSYCRRET